MVRWEPGARERLQEAALTLFLSQGYEQTTVEEITRQVGLTERTFFRHFADKREVLFEGQAILQQAFVQGTRTTAPEASPMELVTAGLMSAAAFFSDEHRVWSRRRQMVITANPALKERELLKMAALAAAVAEALRARNVAEPAATLAAETGVTVFGVAFTQWIADGEKRSFAQVAHAVLADLRAMATLAPSATAAD